MDRESPAEDLPRLVGTREKDRGLQVTVVIPSGIEGHLGPESVLGLTQTGQRFLHGILLEARRLAAHESDDLGFTITAKHISQAEIVERRRHQSRRDRWDHLQNLLQNLGWAGVGAAIGSVGNLKLAFGLLLGFGALLLVARGKS